MSSARVAAAAVAAAVAGVVVPPKWSDRLSHLAPRIDAIPIAMEKKQEAAVGVMDEGRTCASVTAAVAHRSAKIAKRLMVIIVVCLHE